MFLDPTAVSNAGSSDFESVAAVSVRVLIKSVARIDPREGLQRGCARGSAGFQLAVAPRFASTRAAGLACGLEEVR